MTNSPINHNKPGFEKYLAPGTFSGKIIYALFYIAVIGIMCSEVVHYFIEAHGDEFFYVDYSNAIGVNGLLSEMAKGNPVGFTGIVYLLSKSGLSVLLAGRFLTLGSTVAFFFTVAYAGTRIFRLSGVFLQMALMTCSLAILGSHYFFINCPDMFYYTLLLWALIFTWKTLQDNYKWMNFAIAGAFLSITILIRPLTLLFFPGIVAAMFFYLLFTQSKFKEKILPVIVYSLGFMFIFLAQQYPALRASGSFEFEKKVHLETAKANWTQRQVLKNLKIAKGEKITTGNTYPSWEECDEYLEKHGQASLPDSPLQVIFWNPSYFFRYFFVGLLMILRFLVRNTGIIFILPFLGLFSLSWKENKDIVFFSVFSICFLILYESVVLSAVEARHVLIPMVLFVLSGVALVNNFVESKKKYANLLVYIQMASVVLILLLDLKFFVAEFLSDKMI